MARAAGKTTKKKATEKQGKRRPAAHAKTKRRSQGQRVFAVREWCELPATRVIYYDAREGIFDNPLMYALSPLGDAGPIHEKFLPELLALQLRAVQHFA